MTQRKSSQISEDLRKKSNIWEHLRKKWKFLGRKKMSFLVVCNLFLKSHPEKFGDFPRFPKKFPNVPKCSAISLNGF